MEDVFNRDVEEKEEGVGVEASEVGDWKALGGVVAVAVLLRHVDAVVQHSQGLVVQCRKDKVALSRRPGMSRLLLMTIRRVQENGR